MPTAAPKQHTAAPGGGRRRSPVPGQYTRYEVEAALEITATELNGFERAGVMGSSTKRKRGDTRPVLYTETDLALARVAIHAYRFGVRGTPLQQVMAAISTKRDRFTAGTTVLLVIDHHYDVTVLPSVEQVTPDLSTRPNMQAVLLLPLTIPPTTSAKRAEPRTVSEHDV